MRVRIAALVALLLFSLSAAADYVPRWATDYDPTAFSGSQLARKARLLADGSMMIAASSFPGHAIVRFDTNGTVLSSVFIEPQNGGTVESITPFGEVYLLTWTTTGFAEPFVLKYDGITGAQAWAGPAGMGPSSSAVMTVDNAGNPVVASDNGIIHTIRKLSGVDGSTIWTNSVTLPATRPARAVEVDASDNVVVASIATGAGNNNMHTAKLRGTDGVELWSAIYDNNSSDLPRFAAVDHAGDVLVVGTTLGTGTDIALVKYSGASGAEQWRRITAGPTSSFDEPTAVVVDAENNLFIAATNMNGPFTDLMFLKYTPSGTRTIFTGTSGNRDDRVNALAVDGFGHLCYTGITGGVTSGTDLIAGKLNGNTGAPIWSQQYDRTLNRDDAGAGIAVNGSGDVLVAANSYDIFTNDDITFMKRNGATGASMVLVHQDPFNDPSHTPRSMVLGPGNLIHAAGEGSFGYHFQKFDGATGAGLTFSGGTSYSHGALAVDAAGNRYEFTTFGGSGSDFSLIKYGTTDLLQWQRTYGASSGSTEIARAMTVDGAGDPIGTGSSFTTGPAAAIVTVKYNSAGTLQWTHSFNGTFAGGNDVPVAVLTDASNNVFVAGTAVNSGSIIDLVVIKINGATGAQMWATSINSSGAVDDTAFALALDGSGNPIIAGRFGSGFFSDTAVVKLDSTTGGEIWRTTVPSTGADEPQGIALDSAGDVIVAGTSSSDTFTGDIFTFKLNGTTGAFLWSATHDSGLGRDAGIGVRITSTDEIVVAGTVMRAAPYFEDLAVIRYTSAGAVATGPAFYDTGVSDFAEDLVLIGDEPVVLGRNNDRFLLVRLMEALSITTTTLPPAYCGLPYNATVAAINGTPPYTWSVTSGLLPPGTSLDPPTGVISGTAGINGTPFTPRIRVTDSTSAFFERDFVISGFPGSQYTPIFSAANPVCGSTMLSVGGSWSSYLWQPNGETTPTIMPALSHPTLFGVLLEDGMACVTRGALLVHVLQPLSAVTINLTGSANLCNTPTGGTATVSQTGGGTSTYQWGYRTTSGGPITDIAGETGTSYVVTTSDFPPSGGTFLLVARATPFCGSAMVSNEIAVTIANPGVPASLAANATGDNAITLTWTASTGSGFDHYNIYRSDKLCPGTTFTKIGETAGLVTTYADNTVVTGGSYAYKVTAAGSGNSCETAQSNCDDAVAYGECPLEPTFAGATSATPNGCFIRVTWASATSNCPTFPSVVYNVYRSTSPSFTPSAANRIASCVINTGWDDDTVSTGTTYYYIVRAEDSSVGNGGPCNSGNEDTNTVTRSATASGSAVTVTVYSDAFEAPNRPPSNPDAYWIEQIEAGADQLSLSTCRSSSPATSYKIGNPSVCFGGTYADNVRNNLILGGNGSVSPSINGIAIPATLTNIRLRFRHFFQIEPSWDGVALYYSTTSATGPFTIVNDSVAAGQPYILSPPYSGNLIQDGGHRAWFGTQTAFAPVVVNLDALAGQTVWFRWRFYSDSSVTYEGYYLDDVSISGDTALSCATPPNPVQAFSATSTDGTNHLEWLNPSLGSYGATMIRFRTDGGFPASIADGTHLVTINGTAGEPDSHTHSGLTNGLTYYYSAFVNNGAGVWSRSRMVAARPQTVSGVVKWVYATGASAMTPPGIGSVFAVSNDRILHSMNAGASGGKWPAAWKPMVMNAPSQARPPVPRFPLGSATKEVYLGSQDGHVYCIDGNTGDQIWRTATPVAEMVQGAANGMFTVYGGAYNLTLAGTRNSSLPNRFFALDATTGATKWTFDNGGGGDPAQAIGIITGDAAVEYNNRVFFASRAAAGGSDQTLWALSFTDMGATKLWSAAIGDSDGSPTVWNGRVYIGTNSGLVYAFDRNSGAMLWSFATNDGPVKGFVNVDWVSSSGRLYFATTNRVWAITDIGSSATLDWSVSLTRPSIPLFIGSALLAGSGDGRLYQFTNLASATPAQTSIVLGAGTAGVGSPSYDVANNLVYVGNEAGAIYAVSLPLP